MSTQQLIDPLSSRRLDGLIGIFRKTNDKYLKKEIPRDKPKKGHEDKISLV